MIEDIPERSEFDSVDPAPASNERSVSDLRRILCDEEEKMFQRMRALFALRNIGGKIPLMPWRRLSHQDRLY